MSWLVYVGCNENNSQLTQPSQSERIETQSIALPKEMSKITYENEFQTLAKGLALTFADEMYRTNLDNAISQTKTKNVEQILDLHTFLKNHSSVLNKVVEQTNKTSSDEILNSFSKFPGPVDVYFPVDEHRANWRSAKEIWVAYVPFGVEDTEMKTITAYTSPGEVKVLDAQKAPDLSQPILVVEPCEHNGEHSLKDDGHHLKMLNLPCEDCGGGSGGSGGGTPPSSPPHAYGDSEYLSQIKIINDHEPWYKGDPEIYVVVGSPIIGKTNRLWYSGLNDENKWYNYNTFLFYWYENTIGSFIRVAVGESDGGSYKVTIGYQGISVSISFNDGDDDLGSSIVDFRDPNDQHYDTGDSQFVMHYNSRTTRTGS